MQIRCIYALMKIIFVKSFKKHNKILLAITTISAINFLNVSYIWIVAN